MQFVAQKLLDSGGGDRKQGSVLIVCAKRIRQAALTHETESQASEREREREREREMALCGMQMR